MKLLVFGGDTRQIVMAQALGQEGFFVELFGFDAKWVGNIPLPCREVGTISYGEYDLIVFPIPVSEDDLTFHTPLLDRKIQIQSVLSALHPGQVVVGGLFSEKLLKDFSHCGVRAWDYFEREEFSIRNAIPAAEGAIAIAMNETPFTLHGAECLVVGNGRVGKILSKMLWGIGAKVTVSARKCRDLAWIEANGKQPLPMEELERAAGRFDVIFNTVPYPVLSGSVLRGVKKHCLLIDLASKPGGIDLKCAKTLGLNAVWALSLPGTVAPETAGIIMKDTILNICSEYKLTTINS